MRVIDADEAIINCGFEWDDIPPTREEFAYFLKKQPTIDAVPVVRCCECKFGVTPYGDEHDGWIECSNIHGRPLFGCNDFCSYGERKDGDRNE